MAKMITVTIDDGSFAVDLTGFNGQGCDAVAKLFEDIGTTTKSIKKPEYKATQVNQVRK